ncbi:hypothetical protein IKF81_01080, partial [Candidatus Saccharibacteria bacterium]|nr:hypothetical protein [Candidatus Saccharibacteria bacterium]
VTDPLDTYKTSGWSAERATQYVGDYYNWYAATAESGSYTTTSGNMQDSICPKGWGLPVNGDAQTSKSWINLLFTSYSLQDNDSTSSLNAQKTPLSLVYSGYYYWVNGTLYTRGLRGYFWSSTPYSAAGAHYLTFYSTRLIPQGGDVKISGFTVRCVGQ